MRKSGILLHISSLPNKNGKGRIDKAAQDFIHFLAKAGQKIWQVLPINPVGFGGSPYQCYSVFAGDTNLIDESAFISTYNLEDYKNFLSKHSSWLNDYALFTALKVKHNNLPWYNWEKKYKFREEEAIAIFAKENHVLIEQTKFNQFVFFIKWQDFRKEANQSGIEIFGDLPIYPSPDSSDVWARPDLFQYDESLNPQAVAGVPPDYFSEDGQYWGNPLYCWENYDIFDWWMRRIEHNFEMFDIIRIDHFRGLESYWSIPYGEETAKNGEWKKAPGKKLLSIIFDKFPNEKIIAEDLGIITSEVENLRNSFGLAGMKILQFAFNEGYESSYLPHRINENCVVYTGTHDNNTTLGWHKDSKRTKRDKAFTLKYLNCNEEEIVKAMIRAAWASPSKIAIAPMQDFLELGAEARMNTPGTIESNWNWQMNENSLSENLANWILDLTRIYFR